MRTVSGLAIVSAWAGVAEAQADKPVIGPAPAWVKAVAIPAADSKAGDAAIAILLQDQQVALEPGRRTSYAETAIRIQTPQGLGAGNIFFPWRPETDLLTIHKLLIRRGSEVINVLASRQTFTVARRETNLDSAMLDGVLTANIQPEGLQVGDILHFALSVSSSDPVLKGHVEQMAGGWDGLPVGRAHFRMQWPSSLPLRLRQTKSLPPLRPKKENGTTSVELLLDGLQPLDPPKGAPARYNLGRIIEATDFASWSDMAALEAPL